MAFIYSHISMPGGQFSHFQDKMSLARDTGHRGSIPGRSQPFRDGWQAYSKKCNFYTFHCIPACAETFHISISASSLVGELECRRVGLSASSSVGDLVVGDLVCRRVVRKALYVCGIHNQHWWPSLRHSPPQSRHQWLLRALNHVTWP